MQKKAVFYFRSRSGLAAPWCVRFRYSSHTQSTFSCDRINSYARLHARRRRETPINSFLSAPLQHTHIARIYPTVALDTKNKSPPAIIYVKLNDFICSREITFWANSSKQDLSPSQQRGKKEIDICTTSVINYQTREILIMGMAVRRGHWKCLVCTHPRAALLFLTYLRRKKTNPLFCGTGEFA